jgi:Gluconate 2-dehydrogenase subunit 3
VSPSRRNFLLGFGALASVGASGTAWVRTRGYEAPVGAPLRGLSASEHAIVVAVAERMCAADNGDAPSPSELGVARFVDVQVAMLDAPLRRDLGRFLQCVEHLAPIAVGARKRFTALPPSMQDQVLRKLESNGSEMCRGGFQGLKALIMMGYYRDDRTFVMLGYEGPRVKR